MLSVRDATIADITDAGLTLYLDKSPFVAWGQIRNISVRQGPERKWWIPTAFAMVGSGLLGAGGRLLDNIKQSASGQDQGGVAAVWGILIGALGAGALGTLVMYVFPGPRWITLVEAPRGIPPLTLETFAARAAETARATPAVDSQRPD